MKEILLVLMEVSVHQKKKLIKAKISKAKTKFCLTLHDSSDNSYLFVNGKEIYKFEVSNKNANFPSQFFLGSILIDLTTMIQKKYF